MSACVISLGRLSRGMKVRAILEYIKSFVSGLLDNDHRPTAGALLRLNDGFDVLNTTAVLQEHRGESRSGPDRPTGVASSLEGRRPCTSCAQRPGSPSDDQCRARPVAVSLRAGDVTRHQTSQPGRPGELFRDGKAG